MTDRELLRHTLAVLAYRGGKLLKGAPPEFAGYDSGGGQTPLVILGHIGDLLDWALTLARGEGKWRDQQPLGRAGGAAASRMRQRRAIEDSVHR